MKREIHPDYHPVVFEDSGNGFAFLSRSTRTSEQTVVWEDGRTYPLIKVEVSSASHPFYTGQMRIVDTAGRVERFERRHGVRRRTTSEGDETRGSAARNR